MIYIFRLILFIISYIGLVKVVNDKLKLKKEFSLALTTAILILVLFISSLLNILKISSILLFLFGLINFIIFIIKYFKEKKVIKFNYKYTIIGAFLIYLAILSFQFEFTSYDNFSHWGLIIKQLFTFDTLPSFEYNVVEFTSYPPASALFIYYVGFIVGKVESTMILGQLYLTFIFLTPIMVLISDKSKVKHSIVFILFALLTFISNIGIMDLSVDTILGVIGISSCVIAYYYRDDLKKSFILLTILSALFVVTKNSGVVFVVFNALLLLLIGIKNKKLKKSLFYIFLLFLISGAFLILWQQHLRLVYPADIGLSSKHSLSITNFKRTISQNGITQTKQVLLVYLKNIINFKNIINIYMIGVNIFLLFNLILFKKYRKQIFKVLLFVDFIFLGYWLILGAMYILSMPYKEAIKLASFERYMMSSIIIIFSIVVMLYYYLDSNNKCKFYSYIMILVLIILIYFNAHKQLFGIDTYDESNKKAKKEINEIVSKYDISNYNDKDVMFYFNKCDFLVTYYYFMFKYEYFRNGINITCDVDKVDSKDILDDTLIIIPRGDVQIKNKKILKEIKNNMYLKEGSEK